MNRNHWLASGTVVLLWGLTFNSLHSVTLHHQIHHVVEEKRAEAARENGDTVTPMPRTLTPPNWLRYALMSVGGVLLLHAVAMKKPG